MKPTTSKQELAEAVAKHFAQLPPPEDEASIIESFALAVKNQGKERRIQSRHRNDRLYYDDFLIAYPEELLHKSIYNNDSIKFSINLEGHCDLVQSNLVLIRPDKEHFGYFPLLCPEMVSPKSCKISISTADISFLQSAKYMVKLLFVSKEGDGGEGYGTMEWTIGAVDFTNARILDGRRGTSDQLEDTFETIESENRPAFEVRSREAPLYSSVVMSAILAMPLAILFWAWSRMGIMAEPLRKFLEMTLTQKLFGILLFGWFGLAIASWLILDIFGTLKLSISLVLPTIYIGTRALRETNSTSIQQPSEKKTN